VSTLARVEDEGHDDVAVARLEGEIDASNVSDVLERLRSLVSNRSVAMVIDLSATTYLDSAGINILFALGEEMHGRQLRLALVVTPESPILRMITITGLDRVLPVHPGLPEALGAVRGD
jgi:anti-anti-sigma factor